MTNAELAKYPAWLVNEDSTFWVPAGGVPVITGVSTTVDITGGKADLADVKKTGNNGHCICLGVTPVFDVEFIK